MALLTEAEFQRTMRKPMLDVTTTGVGGPDIWPYVKSIATEAGVPAQVWEGERVEYVYRSGDTVHDHVLLATGKRDEYLVIVVDYQRGTIIGHRRLELRKVYGLS